MWTARQQGVPRLPQFPVGLAVQLVRPDEAAAGSVGGPQQDQVGGHALVLVKEDEVADLELGGGDDAGPCARQHRDRCAVGVLSVPTRPAASAPSA